MLALGRYRDRDRDAGKETCAVNADVRALGVLGFTGGGLGSSSGSSLAVGGRWSGDGEVVVLVIDQIFVFSRHLKCYGRQRGQGSCR